jgi:hypothetical protein
MYRTYQYIRLIADNGSDVHMRTVYHIVDLSYYIPHYKKKKGRQEEKLRFIISQHIVHFILYSSVLYGSFSKYQHLQNEKQKKAMV